VGGRWLLLPPLPLDMLGRGGGKLQASLRHSAFERMLQPDASDIGPKECLQPRPPRSATGFKTGWMVIITREMTVRQASMS